MDQGRLKGRRQPHGRGHSQQGSQSQQMSEGVADLQQHRPTPSAFPGNVGSGRGKGGSPPMAQSGNGNSPYTKTDSLEDRLRGMIIKNESDGHSQPSSLYLNPPHEPKPRRSDFSRASANPKQGDPPILNPSNQRQPHSAETRKGALSGGAGANRRHDGRQFATAPPEQALTNSSRFQNASPRSHPQRSRSAHTSMTHAPQFMRGSVDNSSHHRLYNPNGPPQSSQGAASFQRRSHLLNEADQLQYISSTFHADIEEAGLSHEELDARERLRMTLEKLSNKTVTDFESERSASFPQNTVKLHCYGSLATTFATKGSDVDLMLLSPASVPEPAHADSELPRVVEKALLNAGYGARLLSKTRVPIIKFCEKPTPELFERLLAARKTWETETEASLPQKQDQNEGGEPKKGKEMSTKCEEQKNTDRATRDTSTAGEPPSQIPDTVHENLVRNGRAKDAEHESAAVERIASQGVANARTVELEGDDEAFDGRLDEERVRLYRLAMKEDWYEHEERAIIFDFIRAFEANGDLVRLKDARQRLKDLPNILKRYRTPPERHLEYPKEGVGIQCDINFQNILALQNSKLLRCYSFCDPRVRSMVLFIKTWAKRRKINSPYESTLSSYGYVLMVLHYLVNVARPPVLPNLQHHPYIGGDRESLESSRIDDYNVQFFRNEEWIKQIAAEGQINKNGASLEALVFGFYKYFGSDGMANFHWMRDVLSLRTPGGIVSKQAKGWTAAKTEVMEAGSEKKDIRQRYLIAIEDPFETHHNVGRTVGHDGIVAIRDEFRRAWRLIQEAGRGNRSVESLTEEAPSRGNLQFRYFGPRPRKKPPPSNNMQVEGKSVSTAIAGPEAQTARP